MSNLSAEALLLRLPVILLALTIHEFAHGWSAFKLGDSTAKHAGRLTLNPIPHLDLLGTIMLMTGLFGWAKPVPVNPYNLRDPKRDMMVISFAGPLSNIILAVCFGLAIKIIAETSPMSFLTLTETANGAAYKLNYLWDALILAFQINVGLAFFNMLPFYPLDGSKVLAGFLPDGKVEPYMNATRHALPLIFGLVIIGAVINVPILSKILGPVFMPVIGFMQLVSMGSWNGLEQCINLIRTAASGG
ncbi:MAG: site-2 protease family protein [Chitinispirillia bacterium]|nr:site-2 protease family protein [Chitinispirillia bacterium]MCL2269094.1 site-2 protease family protein [Chitinispirillia bacterium]